MTRVSIAAVALATVFALSQQGPLQAGPQPVPVVPESLLPHNIGIGVATDQTVTIAFEAPMERASVEAGLQILPRQEIALTWDAEGRALSIAAGRRWQADQNYLIVVATDSRRDDGSELGEAERFAFTTQTAPRIIDFQVAFSEALTAASLGPSETAGGVSPGTSISIRFDAPMDAADVEEAFAITPAVTGELSWTGQRLRFTPSEPLESGKRYTISLVGAHDAIGNVIGGKANFSFTTQASAQVVSVTPALGATDVTENIVEIWFSRPMNVEATEAGFSLVDAPTETATAGMLSWNETRTLMTFVPDAAFAAGQHYEVRIAAGAKDAEGNPLEYSWTFTTAAPLAEVVASGQPAGAPTSVPAPVVPPPAPSSDLLGYGLAQINSARAAYGFAPVVLDAGATAAAYAHAYDQAVNNYFSHTSVDGRTRVQRLQAAGVSFGYSGENQCYHAGGIGQQATIDWCHGAFMIEPYCSGCWNHIGNILDPRFRRVGIGIAEIGGRVVITWNFVD